MRIAQELRGRFLKCILPPSFLYLKQAALSPLSSAFPHSASYKVKEGDGERDGTIRKGLLHRGGREVGPEADIVREVAWI